MANTKPDVTVPNNTWIDLNTATSIAVGSAMIIQNKGTANLYVQITSTKPDDAATDGIFLFKFPHYPSYLTIDAGNNKVWIKSAENTSGKVNVQG